MGHHFESEQSVEVDATIADVWDAIATGSGIDSWFMGRTDVADGHVRTMVGGYAPDATITIDEPGKRFAYATPAGPDGRFVAYDFLIEARAGGATSIRVVTSGFVPGDDWTDEFEAMTKGGALFFGTLIEYLQHFAGRAATPVTAFGPLIADWPAAWITLGAALGLDRAARSGDAVRLRRPDGGDVEGTVYFVNDDTLGVRTTDALYRFVHGFGGPILAMHHVFAPGPDVAPDPDTGADPDADAAWTDWLQRVLG